MPISRSIRQQKNLRHIATIVIPTILIILPVLLTFFYVFKFGINIPFWDEWQMVPRLQLFRNGGNWLTSIWQHDNIHKHFFSRLIILFLSETTDWNIVVEMYVNALLITTWVSISWLVYKKVTKGGLWGYVPVAWLLCSWGQWENILWGWHITLFLMIVSVTATIYLISLNTSWAFLSAMGAGILASYSFSNGLLVWPIGLLMLLIMRISRRRIGLWLICGILTILIFLIGFDPATIRPPAETVTYSLNQLVIFQLANMGAPLSGGHLSYSTMVGLLILIMVGYLIFSRIRWLHRQGTSLDVADAIVIALFAFSFGSSFMITVGRIGYDHLEWAVGSRYTTSASLGIFGIYLELVRRNQNQTDSHLSQALLAGFLVFLSLGLTTAYTQGYERGETRRVRMQQLSFALHYRQKLPDHILGGLYIAPSSLRRWADYLEEERLSLFSEPPNILLHTILGDGVPFDEILPERPLIQQFICPVDTIHDFAILFATYGRQNNALYQISLLRDDETIWMTQFSADKLKDNSLYHFQPNEPINHCYQDDLILKIETANGAPGNALTAWTYPPFYEAIIMDPHKNSLKDNVLALEINTCYFKLKNCELHILK